jgi:hypothetical protein
MSEEQADLLLAYSSALINSGLSGIPSVSIFIKKFLAGHSSPPEMHHYARRAWLDSNKSIISVWDSLDTPYTMVNALRKERSQAAYLSCLSIFEDEKNFCQESLSTKGYYVFKNKLPREFVLILLNEISSAGLVPEIAGQARSERLISRQDAFKNNNQQSLRFFYPKIVLDTSEAINTLVNCSPLNAIVSKYLNGKPFHSSRSAWLSIGKKEQDFISTSNAAQEFHYDFDALKFLKVFVYLSDVDEQSGAHQFIASSHKPFPTLYSSSFPNYFRATKSQLLSLYTEDNFCTFKGDMGTVIIEDTSGFHRGCPLHPNCSRDILMLQYRDSDIPSLSHGCLLQ